MGSLPTMESVKRTVEEESHASLERKSSFEEDEDLEGFTKRLQIVQTVFDKPRRPSIVLPLHFNHNIRRKSVSFDDSHSIMKQASENGEEEEVGNSKTAQWGLEEKLKKLSLDLDNLHETESEDDEEQSRYPVTPPPKKDPEREGDQEGSISEEGGTDYQKENSE